MAETAERLVRDGRTLKKGRHLQAGKQAFTLERPSADPATRADPPGARTVTELMAVAQYFRLSDDAAAATLGEVVTAVAPWRQVATRNGLSSKELHLMQPAFEHAQAAAARDHLAATA